MTTFGGPLHPRSRGQLWAETQPKGAESFVIQGGNTSEGARVMNAVRISNGHFDFSKLAEVERAFAASQSALRESLEKLPGLIHFYAGIDREKGYVTNVSVWDSLEAAKQLNTFQPMLDQRPVMEAAGVTFEPITNHEMLWTIAP
jgi:hypothetical protein